MNFSRYSMYFIILSVVGLVSMFGVTFSAYGGFAPSITFNGGIRFSVVLPGGQGAGDLRTAAEDAGFEVDQVRQTDVRSNIFVLEMGPRVRDEIQAELNAENEEKDKQVEALRDQGLEIPEELARRRTVAEVIEERLLPRLQINPENVLSRETIAASYGANLTRTALQILIGTIITIGLYLTFRFDFPFAVGASLALVHDLLLTLAFIGVMQIEPSIPVLAAVLTTLGYSINDTIVIFDRIRENVTDRQQATFGATIDLSITQTLSRTVITSLLTLLALLALLLSGADTLRDFAVVIIFGIIVGTYSSIFIASRFVQFYENLRARS